METLYPRVLPAAIPFSTLRALRRLLDVLNADPRLADVTRELLSVPLPGALRIVRALLLRGPVSDRLVTMVKRHIVCVDRHHLTWADVHATEAPHAS